MDADSWLLMSEKEKDMYLQATERGIYALGYEAKSDAKDTPDCNYKAELLDRAAKIVNGDRNVQYGEPNADFKRTAALWTTYLESSLRVDLSAHDVAVMMILLKISRLTWSPGKEDHWLDIAGYAACGWDTVNRNPTIELC